MKLIDKLEKRLGFLAVPNVVLTLVVAQLVIYAAILIGRVEFTSLLLVPKAVLGGEWWRMVSFLFAPPYMAGTLFQALFLAFFWYIFWMMSNTLQEAWGQIRFNLYLIIGIVTTIIGAFAGQLISSGSIIIVSPYFLYLSIFFAFATLNPNIQFLVFFVIPMKVKWLAWFVAAMTAFSFLFAPSMGDRVAILFPLINYFLFFKDGFKQSVVSRQRRSKFDADKRERGEEALHTCAQCGASDNSHPERDFRYKSAGSDMICICEVCRESAG